MRKLVFLPLLVLALACGDGNPLQPDDSLSLDPQQPGLVVSEAPGANVKIPFELLAEYWGQDDPGGSWVSPGGILHGFDLINRFRLSGDFQGWWFFDGDFMLNLNSGKGRSRARPALFQATEGEVGDEVIVGTFECVGTFKLENYPGPEFIQYGNITGCHGSGIFEGMKMNGYTINVEPGSSNYAMWGEIW